MCVSLQMSLMSDGQMITPATTDREVRGEEENTPLVIRCQVFRACCQQSSDRSFTHLRFDFRVHFFVEFTREQAISSLSNGQGHFTRNALELLRR